MSDSDLLTGASPPALSAAAAATHAAIVETAERLFRTLGYQKTTVADIARELRMSPANVYRFFPSKAAINEAICARILAGLDSAIWDVARGPGTPPDRLRAMFRLLQEQTMALFFRERRMHEIVEAALEENWPTVERHIDTVAAAFSHVVKDGQAQGVFAALDPAATGRMLHATCPLFTHPTLVQQKCAAKEDLPALATGMAEFCLRALRPD